MIIKHFRDPKPGPELELEKFVTSEIPQIFSEYAKDKYFWTGYSVPIGAGLPDLLLAICKPQIFALSKLKIAPDNILSYLRAVRNVRLETISKRIGYSEKVIIKYINDLIELEIVDQNNNTFFLKPEWRNIIPELISIEVKVANWKKVIDQAIRNTIYSHRSYIAIPEKIAFYIKSNSNLKKYGIGILSIKENGRVNIIKNARKSQPTIWSYYYKIASIIAQKH